MTKEERKAYGIEWRKNNPEKVKNFNLLKDEKRRHISFKGENCRSCQKPLSFWAKRTRFYCYNCRENGLAEKHSKKIRDHKYQLKKGLSKGISQPKKVIDYRYKTESNTYADYLVKAGYDPLKYIHKEDLDLTEYEEI